IFPDWDRNHGRIVIVEECGFPEGLPHFAGLASQGWREGRMMTFRPGNTGVASCSSGKSRPKIQAPGNPPHSVRLLETVREVPRAGHPAELAP
ncbi:MAG TPA: hypothetical protein VN673_18575, partial [Clostridia bacterium]|nr:hypothetical protein [Clostridia bacterium]